MGDTWRWNTLLQRQHDLEPYNKSTVSWRQTLCDDISVEQGMTTVKHARVYGNWQDQSHPCQYVRATQDERHAALPPAVTNLSCAAQLCWTRLPTWRILMWVFQAPPHIVGLVPIVPGHELTYTSPSVTVVRYRLNETCNKDKGHCTKHMSVHILQFTAHIKIGCTPVRRTWELFKSSPCSLSMQVIKFASATGFSVLVPPFLLDTLWSILLKRKLELIVRVSLHWRWAAEVIRPLHWDLKFDFECLRAVRCTWIKCHWKLVHSPYQHPSASGLWKNAK